MPDLNWEFDKSFVKHVSLSRHLAWRTIGLLLQSMELLGAVQVAKSWLAKARKLGMGFPDPGSTKTESNSLSLDLGLLEEMTFISMTSGTAEIVTYYDELRRHELAHLSIEAFVIQSPWKALFTTQELDGAREALPAALVAKLEELHDEGPKSRGFQVPKRILDGRAPSSKYEGCRRVAEEALSVDRGSKVDPIPWIRVHLSDCHDCALRQRPLVETYADFDRSFFSDYRLLATQLIQIMPTDELLEKAYGGVVVDEDDFLSEEETLSAQEIHEIEIELLLDPLAARFLVLAAYLGGRMLSFAHTFAIGHSPLWWWQEALKGQSPPSVAKYIREWNQDSRHIALIAVLAKGLWQDSEFGEGLSLPEAYQGGELIATDGITVRDTFIDPREWLNYDLIPSPPAGIWVWGMMEQVVDLASHQLANLAPKPASTDEDKGKLNAILLNISDITERLVSQSRAGAEQHLSELMGRVYGLLPTKVRYCLLGGEQIYRNPEHADPSQIVSAFTKAFELCVRIEFLNPLQEFLAREGIRDFPNSAGQLEQNQVRFHGKANRRCNLGVLTRSFDNQPEIMRKFCESRGLEFEGIRSVLKFMTQQRNNAVHEATVTHAEAAEARVKMLADGRVFRAFFRPERSVSASL